MEKVNFGVTKRGEEASLYVLENKNNTTITMVQHWFLFYLRTRQGYRKTLYLGMIT